ncbi:MAG: DNA repair protein RadA [Acidimicrobiales bacterium]
MAKHRVTHQCSACGVTSLQWVGRCPGCDAWNTLVPSGDGAASSGPVRVGDVPVDARPARPTGVDELDRVLGGGLVPGSVTLLGGEPGIGKSTLLLQAAASAARRGQRSLYVSAEESASQVRVRAERLGAVAEDLWLVHETDLEAVVRHVHAVEAELVVVDSVQTVHDAGGTSGAGSVTQVRTAAGRFVELAKRTGTAVVLVGHVTKDGALAGPRQLEHVVDTVLAFEGERHHALRLLRAVKHRFGPTDDLGVFEMTGAGLTAVPDPSGLFLADCRWGVPGAGVVAAMDGRRPLLVEVQALASQSGGGPGRRAAIGLDNARVSMVAAVMATQAHLSLVGHDIWAAVAGGFRVAEPAADLGIALALASAVLQRPLPSDLVCVGEVGLAGELRQVGHLDRRLGEAARLGFTRAVVPMLAPEVDADLHCLRVASLGEAIELIAQPSPVGG